MKKTKKIQTKTFSLSQPRPRPLPSATSKNSRTPCLPRLLPRLCGSGLFPRRLEQEQKRCRAPLRAAFPGDELDFRSAGGLAGTEGEPPLGRRRLFFFGFGLALPDQGGIWQQQQQQQY